MLLDPNAGLVVQRLGARSRDPEEVRQGDRHGLDEAVHWHGVRVPNALDGT